jgi:hypothetical protein
MSTEDPAELKRSISYMASNQGQNKICTLLSITNTLAHNICLEMGWVEIDYKKKKSFNFGSLCEDECGREFENLDTSFCKCCLLRHYIKIIILNEFPDIKEKGANVQSVISFIDLCFCQLFLSENLYETIENHLYSDRLKVKDIYKSIIVPLTSVFGEIISINNINSITFYVYFIENGNVSTRNFSDKKDELNKLFKDGLYAIFDVLDDSFLEALNADIIVPSLLEDPSVLLSGNPEKINDFMHKLSKIPKASHLVTKDAKEVADTCVSSLGHSTVLKGLFDWYDKKMAVIKNSWGLKVGIKGEHVISINNVRGIAFMPIFTEYSEEKLAEKIRILIQQNQYRKRLQQEKASQKQINHEEKIDLKEVLETDQPLVVDQAPPLELHEAPPLELHEPPLELHEAPPLELHEDPRLADQQADQQLANQQAAQQLANQQAAQQLANQLEHQQAAQQQVIQQLDNQQVIIPNQKRRGKGIVSSLEGLPKKKGGNRYSKKIKCKKSKRNKRQKINKTVKRYRRMRKTITKK